VAFVRAIATLGGLTGNEDRGILSLTMTKRLSAEKETVTLC
jgi:hypothetical protein